MTEPQTVRVISGWMKDWPDWLLIFCFLVLALCFALAGALSDWLRFALCLTFIAIAFSLIARWKVEHPTQVVIETTETTYKPAPFQPEPSIPPDGD